MGQQFLLHKYSLVRRQFGCQDNDMHGARAISLDLKDVGGAPHGDNDDNRHSPRYLKQAPVGHGIFPAAFFCFGYYVAYQLTSALANYTTGWPVSDLQSWPLRGV
jgi:hypothetical protein